MFLTGVEIILYVIKTTKIVITILNLNIVNASNTNLLGCTPYKKCISVFVFKKNALDDLIHQQSGCLINLNININIIY